MRQRDATRRVAAAALALLVLAWPAPATAASWQAKLLATDRFNSDFLGETVAISGGTIVAGAKNQEAGGFDRGAAYVFVRAGTAWVQQAKLTASDGANSDHLGSSVAISGDTAVIGSPGDDDRGTSSGSAYVFIRSNGVWSQAAKLTAADGALGDEFGAAVAVAGDTVIVGARRDDDRALDAGSAYVFRRSDGAWTQETKLMATDGQSGDLFGHSLSTMEDAALISAYGDDDRGTEAGAAYFFSRSADGWIQDSKVVAPDGAAGDMFGFSLSLSREAAVVSAFGDDDGEMNSGSAYVLRRADGVWKHEAKLRPNDPVRDSVFGRAAAIDGNAAVIGASLDDTLGRDSGAVYAFERRNGQWVQRAKLTAPDGAEADLLGYSVAIEGETGAVGAPLDDDRANATGSVHVFTGLADIGAPLISAEVDPPANAAGWHKDVPVEISFICTDDGSGIASCTEPVSLSDEPGTTVTGTAVDQAGNAASVSVEIHIDTTPPEVAIDDPSPVPGVPVLAAEITGNATDALSGVDGVAVTFTNLLTSAEETRAATRNGATWSVATDGLPPGPTSATATSSDRAGNVSLPESLVLIVGP